MSNDIRLIYPTRQYIGHETRHTASKLAKCSIKKEFSSYKVEVTVQTTRNTSEVISNAIEVTELKDKIHKIDIGVDEELLQFAYLVEGEKRWAKKTNIQWGEVGVD